MAASVCMKFSKVLMPSCWRPVALMMPCVTVWPTPKGLPMASTTSPTCMMSDWPKTMTGNFSNSIFSNARSVSGSLPTRCAMALRPSARPTRILAEIAAKHGGVHERMRALRHHFGGIDIDHRGRGGAHRACVRCGTAAAAGLCRAGRRLENFDRRMPLEYFRAEQEQQDERGREAGNGGLVDERQNLADCHESVNLHAFIVRAGSTLFTRA